MRCGSRRSAASNRRKSEALLRANPDLQYPTSWPLRGQQISVSDPQGLAPLATKNVAVATRLIHTAAVAFLRVVGYSNSETTLLARFAKMRGFCPWRQCVHSEV